MLATMLQESGEREKPNYVSRPWPKSEQVKMMRGASLEICAAGEARYLTIPERDLWAQKRRGHAPQTKAVFSTWARHQSRLKAPLVMLMCNWVKKHWTRGKSLSRMEEQKFKKERGPRRWKSLEEGHRVLGRDEDANSAGGSETRHWYFFFPVAIKKQAKRSEKFRINIFQTNISNLSFRLKQRLPHFI